MIIDIFIEKYFEMRMEFLIIIHNNDKERICSTDIVFLNSFQVVRDIMLSKIYEA